MRNTTRMVLATVLTGGLGACTAGSVTPAQYGTYNPSMLNYAAGKGPIYTEVVGNPFAAADAEVAQAVTSAMFGAHFGQDVSFTTTRDPENTSPYRVVMLFNPARGVTPTKVCEDSEQPSAAKGDIVHVMAVFCGGSARETSLSGRAAGIAGPHDPAFRALIRRMTAQLFPPKNPNILGGDNDFDI